jgi:asparagine synthase (glutamine-hydrolysing)
MCGISGIFSLKDLATPDRELLRRMNDSMFHRGPDESGLWLAPGVGLGHRRLSIIDLSSGQQPMTNSDQSCVLVFNGEIYNFKPLRAELERLGHSFATRSDTEVLLKSWVEWGEECVSRLRGMFAFAVWDARRQCLFLARDRLGVKPLYYALLASGELVFGSELKALVVHPGFDRTIDPRAIEDYFAYGYVPDPDTIYQQAKKLEAGYTLTIRRDGRPLVPRRYWDVPFTPVQAGSFADAQVELIERLKEAIDIRLVADVPLGAFLSGGVDSSAVVALMAELQSDPVNTCSIAFDVAAYDESQYAERIAKQVGANHSVKRLDPDDFELVNLLPGIYDEPYADSSALPTYRVCQLARERVTVALSGDGGDENFGGYRRYRLHVNEERVRSMLPLGVRRALFGTLGQIYPKADWAPRVFRAKTTFQALARGTVDAYFHTVSLFNEELRDRLFAPKLLRELQGYRAAERLHRYAAQSPTQDPLGLVQYLDMKTYLPGDILTKVDRASMAHALEVREPLLDHELIAWTSGLPSAWKLQGGQGKYFFKKSLESRLPHDILYRPKMGFAVPLAKWFRGALAERIRETVLGPRLRATGWFNDDFLHHLVEAHQRGSRDYSATLWTVMMFDAFLANLS